MKKIIVIGFGFMGYTHADRISVSRKFQLCAIVDRDREIVQKTLSANAGNLQLNKTASLNVSAIPVYTDLDECLIKEKPDAAAICLPTQYHYSIAKKCLSAGLHVFMEKPMCLSADEGRELINLAATYKRVFMIAHCLRFSEEYLYLKKCIDENLYGKPEFISFSRSSGAPSWGGWKNNEVRLNSGGALYDMNIHDIDFLNYLCGKPAHIKSVLIKGPVSTADYILSSWQYTGGLMAHIQGGFLFHSKMPFSCGYICRFSDASLRYSSINKNVIEIASDGNLSQITLGDSDPYREEIDYFCDCVIHGRRPERCLPEDSLEAVILCRETELTAEVSD